MKFQIQTLITIKNLPKLPAAKIKEKIENIFDPYTATQIKYLGNGKILCGAYTTHQTDYVIGLVRKALEND